MMPMALVAVVSNGSSFTRSLSADHELLTKYPSKQCIDKAILQKQRLVAQWQRLFLPRHLPLSPLYWDGYNVYIFAYGQTGTKKTFTMEGTPENRGVNYRTLEELFRISDKRSSTMRHELSVSMLEVYNEKIRDLLADNSSQPAPKAKGQAWSCIQGLDGDEDGAKLKRISII